MSAPAEHAQLDDWDQLIQAGAQRGPRGALVQAGAEAMSYEELCQAHIDAMLQVRLPCLATAWRARPLRVASCTPAEGVVLWDCSCRCRPSGMRKVAACTQCTCGLTCPCLLRLQPPLLRPLMPSQCFASATISMCSGESPLHTAHWLHRTLRPTPV